MTKSNLPLSFSETLSALLAEATYYFNDAEQAIIEAKPLNYIYLKRDEYWLLLPEPLQTKAKELVNQLIPFAGQFAPLLKSSLLNSDSDHRDLVFIIKGMRCALELRDYSHWDIEVLHDEGTVLGVQPPGQSDDNSLSPIEAKHSFTKYADRLARIIQLAEAGGVRSQTATDDTYTNPNTNTLRYRRGTAFIIMSMDKSKPELDDIHAAVVEVFNNFGIQAVRADDIEHDGLITERVLQEIATSEFLFADLTGERPNVYYEVGYAHALRKPVMLYRKADTGIHFDLAAYNCPSYKNVSDLKQQLTKRLTHITNKNLASLDGIGVGI